MTTASIINVFNPKLDAGFAAGSVDYHFSRCFMGTRLENRTFWQDYDWAEGGHEWSVAWGGTEALWWGTLFPRVRAFLPTGTILEIAPGFGRCTQFLKDLCDRLSLVDLSERCIDACRERFAADRPLGLIGSWKNWVRGERVSHISYHVNDGSSLGMISDRSVDFVFSYDSLVHAESEVLEAYITELGRKLTPDGVGFFHHSNLGAFVDPSTLQLTVENPHWRASSMTAKKLVQYCENAGLECVSQEIVNWGGSIMTDCFSLFTVKGSRFSRPYRLLENPEFMAEADRVARVAEQYGLTLVGKTKPATAAPAAPGSSPKDLLRRIRRLFSHTS